MTSSTVGGQPYRRLRAQDFYGSERFPEKPAKRRCVAVAPDAYVVRFGGAPIGRAAAEVCLELVEVPEDGNNCLRRSRAVPDVVGLVAVDLDQRQFASSDVSLA